MKSSTLCGLLFTLLPAVASAGQFSDSLIRTAVSAPQHLQIHDHPFYLALKAKKISYAQLQVFFSDRILFMRELEKRTVKYIINPQDFPSELLFRSKQYQAELDLLPPPFNQIKPSLAAQQYVAFLERQDDDTALHHYLIYLAGEAHGAQLIAKAITSNFSYLGKAIQNLGNPTSKREATHKVGDLLFPDSLKQIENRNPMSPIYIDVSTAIIFNFASNMFSAELQAEKN